MDREVIFSSISLCSTREEQQERVKNQNDIFYQKRSHTPLTHESDVLYFFYRSANRTSFMQDGCLNSKLHSFLSCEAVTRSALSSERCLKICFDIFEEELLNIDPTPATQGLFMSLLPHIDLIQLNGPQSFHLFRMLFNTCLLNNKELFEYPVRLRLSFNAPLSSDDIIKLTDLIKMFISIDPSFITGMIFMNQDLSGSNWQAITQSLSSSAKVDYLSISNCHWQDLMTTADGHIVLQTLPLTQSAGLSLLIEALPSTISCLELSDDCCIAELISNPCFISALKNRVSDTSLVLSLPAQSFKNTNSQMIDTIIALDNENILDIGDIFNYLSCAAMIDYLWHNPESELYADLLETYHNQEILTIKSLPLNPVLFAAFLAALPAKTIILRFISGPLDFNAVLESTEVRRALLSLCHERPHNQILIDIEQASLSPLTTTTLSHIITLWNQGVVFQGLEKHLSLSLFACYILEYDNSLIVCSNLMKTSDPCFSESFRNVLSFYMSEPAKELLQEICDVNQSFALSHIKAKTANLAHSSLLQLIIEKQSSASQLYRYLNELISAQRWQLDWSNSLARRTQMALRLWSYALTQECPLSLQESYTERMLSEANDDRQSIGRYGFVQVSFAVFPQIVIDALSCDDKYHIKKILHHLYRSLLQQQHYDIEDLIHPFLIVESHDPTALIRHHSSESLWIKQGHERQEPAPREKHALTF